MIQHATLINHTYNPGQFKSWDKCVLVALYKHAKQRVPRHSTYTSPTPPPTPPTMLKTCTQQLFLTVNIKLGRGRRGSEFLSLFYFSTKVSCWSSRVQKIALPSLQGVLTWYQGDFRFYTGIRVHSSLDPLVAITCQHGCRYNTNLAPRDLNVLSLFYFSTKESCWSSPVQKFALPSLRGYLQSRISMCSYVKSVLSIDWNG